MKRFALISIFIGILVFVSCKDIQKTTENNNQMYRVSFGDKYGFISMNDSLFIPLIYDSAFHFSEGIAWVQTKGKWGAIDEHGTFIIEPQYISVAFPGFSEGLAAVQIENGTWCYVNKDGEVVINNLYEAQQFSEGLACVKFFKEASFQYINKTGEVVISGKGEIIYGAPFSEGFAAICIDKGGCDFVEGYIDTVRDYQKMPQIVVDYPYFSGFHNGVAAFRNNKEMLCGYIDKEGEILTMRSALFALDFNDGIGTFLSLRQDSCTYIDRHGKKLFSLPQYGKVILTACEGMLAYGCDNGKYGFMTINQKTITEPIFDEVCGFRDGYAQVRIGNKWGLLDKKGVVKWISDGVERIK